MQLAFSVRWRVTVHTEAWLGFRSLCGSTHTWQRAHNRMHGQCRLTCHRCISRLLVLHVLVFVHILVLMSTFWMEQCHFCKKRRCFIVTRAFVFPKLLDVIVEERTIVFLSLKHCVYCKFTQLCSCVLWLRDSYGRWNVQVEGKRLTRMFHCLWPVPLWVWAKWLRDAAPYSVNNQ